MRVLRYPKWVRRLFVGGYKPLRRPQIPVDAGLAARQRLAKEQLRARGIDVAPVISKGERPISPGKRPGHFFGVKQ